MVIALNFVLITRWEHLMNLEKSQNSITQRLNYWRAAIAVIKDHPITGVGPGNLQEVFLDYKHKICAQHIPSHMGRTRPVRTNYHSLFNHQFLQKIQNPTHAETYISRLSRIPPAQSNRQYLLYPSGRYLLVGFTTYL